MLLPRCVSPGAQHGQTGSGEDLFLGAIVEWGEMSVVQPQAAATPTTQHSLKDILYYRLLWHSGYCSLLL